MSEASIAPRTSDEASAAAARRRRRRSFLVRDAVRRAKSRKMRLLFGEISRYKVKLEGPEASHNFDFFWSTSAPNFWASAMLPLIFIFRS